MTGLLASNGPVARDPLRLLRVVAFIPDDIQLHDKALITEFFSLSRPLGVLPDRLLFRDERGLEHLLVRFDLRQGVWPGGWFAPKRDDLVRQELDTRLFIGNLRQEDWESCGR